MLIIDLFLLLVLKWYVSNDFSWNWHYFLSTNDFFLETTLVKVDCNFISELDDNKILKLVHVSSHDKIVDNFTKFMSSTHHAYFESKLMLVDNYHQFEEGYKEEKISSKIKNQEENILSKYKDKICKSSLICNNDYKIFPYIERF